MRRTPHQLPPRNPEDYGPSDQEEGDVLLTWSFPAQNGECFENVRDKSHSLDDREHGCPILPQLEGTECASQRRAIYCCDFPRIAVGKTIFLHLGPPRDLLIGGRTDKLVHRAWQALGIIILTPARDATHRRGAATTRQSAGLGARGVTKTTTGTKTSKLRVTSPGLPARAETTCRHNCGRMSAVSSFNPSIPAMSRQVDRSFLVDLPGAAFNT